MINCLIRSIDKGSLDDTECMVHELAKSELMFNLVFLPKMINKKKRKLNQNQMVVRESTNSFLQLVLGN